MIYLLLADGCEEIEALTPLDLLRRAGLEVVTVGVTGREITGAHGIRFFADKTASEVRPDAELDAVILPGGMPGTTHLDNSPFVDALLSAQKDTACLICAICAAPSVLGRRGLLEGKNATCFPGFEPALRGANCQTEPVVRDGRFITARGMGVALEFGLAIVAALRSPRTAASLRASVQCPATGADS